MSMTIQTDGSSLCCFQTQDKRVWPANCYADLSECPEASELTPSFHMDIKRTMTVTIRPAALGADSDHELTHVNVEASSTVSSDQMSSSHTRVFLTKYYSRPVFAQSPKIAKFLLFAVVALFIFTFSFILDLSAESDLISMGKMREKDIEAAHSEPQSSSSGSENIWKEEAPTSFSLPNSQVVVLESQN